MRQKKFDRKSWHNSLKHKIFPYPKVVTHWRVPLRNFSALWDKNFSTENLDTPPLLTIHKHFCYQKFSETQHRRVPLRNFSALWDNKFSMENRDVPLLGIKFFDTRNFLKHRRVPRRNFSALWDENFSTENRDTLLHKVQKSVVELMFVKTLWKLISKQ